MLPLSSKSILDIQDNTLNNSQFYVLFINVITLLNIRTLHFDLIHLNSNSSFGITMQWESRFD